MQFLKNPGFYVTAILIGFAIGTQLHHSMEKLNPVALILVLAAIATSILSLDKDE